MPDFTVTTNVKHKNKGKPQQHSWFLASIVCLLASTFYLYEFLLQVSPGVMTQELMKAYSVGAAGLGTISAFYYYAYGPMQLPGGLLYDRVGPRILMPIAVLVCAVGTLLFSKTHSAVFASYGRFLIGLGSAFSFTGTLLLISRWFPPQYFALLAGITQSMSSIGALFAETPLAVAIARFGWRQSLMGLSFFGFILALVMAIFIKNHPPSHNKIARHKGSGHSSMAGLKYVVHNPQTWYIAIYGLTIWSVMITFASLWGVPYVKAVYHTSTHMASAAVSMIWIAVGIGSPLAGWVSDRIASRRAPIVLFGIIGLLSSIVVIYIPGLPPSLMYIGLIGLGTAASGQSLTFAIIKDNTPPQFIGAAVGFNNMAVVAGGCSFSAVDWIFAASLLGRGSIGSSSRLQRLCLPSLTLGGATSFYCRIDNESLFY